MTVIVSSETTNDELERIDAEAEAKGLRFAAMSNAGLPPGKLRLTFIPKSAFRNDNAPSDLIA